MIFLVDRNIEGYAILLLGSLTVGEWLELVSVQFVLLEDVGLPITSSDRVVWRFAQALTQCFPLPTRCFCPGTNRATPPRLLVRLSPRTGGVKPRRYK